MQCEGTLLLMFYPLEELCKFKRIHPLCVFLTIKITSPVKTQQFILLFSTTCFSLKGHQQVEYRIKRIYIYIYIYIYMLLTLHIFYIYIFSLSFIYIYIYIPLILYST